MSALSDLLSRAHASLSAKAGLPAPLTLFISMTDGSERAHTARGVGETFEAAWQAATQAAQQLANRGFERTRIHGGVKALAGLSLKPKDSGVRLPYRDD